MAVKFSQFTQENIAANVTELVGYTASGNLNVRIPPANLDTTYTLGASGTTDVVLTLDGTKLGSTPTDSTITITKGTGISFSSISTTGFTISATGDVTTVSAIAPGSPSTGNPLIVTPTTGDVTIQSMAFAGAGNVGHVPSAAAASAGQFLDYTGNWSAPSGAFTGFSITDGATTEVVGNGDIVTFAGGTYINTAVTATDTVTITLDTTVALWSLKGGDGAGTLQAITPGNTVEFKENDGTVVNSVQVGGGVQTKATIDGSTDQLLLDQTSEQVITVAGGVFVVDGASQPTIVLPRGFTYEFNQDAATNNGHPLVIGTASGSSPYTTGIQYYGSTSANTLTAVSEATYTSATTTTFDSWATRRIRLRITQNTPALYYYCSVHGAGMGGSITYGGSSGGFGSINQFTGTGSSLGALTLGSTPTAAQNCLVSISGVTQNYLQSDGSTPNWTVSTNTLTFAFNPPVTAAYGIQIIVIN